MTPRSVNQGHLAFVPRIDQVDCDPLLDLVLKISRSEIMAGSVLPARRIWEAYFLLGLLAAGCGARSSLELSSSVGSIAGFPGPGGASVGLDGTGGQDGLGSTAREEPVGGSPATGGISAFGGASQNQLAVTEISAGTSVSCALITDGTIRCWGANESGQLGNGTTTSSSVPVTVTDITNAIYVSASNHFACASLADGPVVCWGDNAYGQLGNGTTNSPVPIRVTGVSSALTISSSAFYSCALLKTELASCWGYFEFGQGGLYGMPAIAVAAGGTAACGLSADGTIRCWGENIYGELGNNGVASGTPVSNISNAVAIAAGSEAFNCTLIQGGAVQCWGDNQTGVLGTDAGTKSMTPVAIPGISTAVAISAGGRSVCALLNDNTAQCWGDNRYGQLGTGSTANEAMPSPLMQTDGTVVLGNLASVSCSEGGACALTLAGQVYCWGDGVSSLPVLVPLF